MPENIASDRMREMLEYWEDYCGIVEGTARIGRSLHLLEPYYRNWQLLRDRIYDQQVRELNLREWDFTGPMQHIVWMQRYALYPHELLLWSRNGRNAIHLPRELQRPYAEATFPGTRFADVKLQFNSFIITLEEPVRVEDQPGIWTEFDAIWITKLPFVRHGQRATIRCRLLRRPFVQPEQRRLSRNALRRIEVATRRRGAIGGREEFVRIFNRWKESIVEPPGHFLFPLYPSSVRDDDFVADHVTPEFYAHESLGVENFSPEQVEWRAQWVCSIAKIVIGWLVHRKYIPSENYRWDTPQPRPVPGTRGILGVITDPVHICTILRIGSMDIHKYREKNPDKEGSTFFQYPHVRSGYWRREQGAGPKAQKTKWIDQYEVRKDLMPLFGIHGGKMTKIEGDL